MVGRSSRDQALNLWSDNGRAEESQKDESAHGCVLCVGELLDNRLGDLELLEGLLSIDKTQKKKTRGPTM